MLVAVALLAIWPFQASAKTHMWDPWVRDTAGWSQNVSPVSTFDGDHLYWDRATLTRGQRPMVVDELHELTLSTNQDRLIQTVKGGLITAIAAGGGRVAFTTHQTVGTAKGGAVVHAAESLYSIASAGAPAQRLEVRRSTAWLRPSHHGKKPITVVSRSCGKYFGSLGVSATGQLLSVRVELQCSGEQGFSSGFVEYEAGASTPLALGYAGQFSSGLLEANILLNLGESGPWGLHASASTKNLDSGESTSYPLAGKGDTLSLSQDGHFAITSEHGYNSHTDGSKLSTQIFAVGNPTPLGTFNSGTTDKNYTQTTFCGDALLSQELQFPQESLQLTLHGYDGTPIGASVTYKTGNHFVLGLKCEGRHSTIAIFDPHGLPKIYQHDF